MAKPLDEEAHFRIDEMERKFASIPPMESIQAAFTGMLAMALEEMRRVVEKRNVPESSAVIEDVQADKALTDAVREQTQAVRELIECMSKPTMREVTAHLPSGPVTMRVNETRN